MWMIVLPVRISVQAHNCATHARWTYYRAVPVFERWCSSFCHNRVRIRALIFNLSESKILELHARTPRTTRENTTRHNWQTTESEDRRDTWFEKYGNMTWYPLQLLSPSRVESENRGTCVKMSTRRTKEISQAFEFSTTSLESRVPFRNVSVFPREANWRVRISQMQQCEI